MYDKYGGSNGYPARKKFKRSDGNHAHRVDDDNDPLVPKEARMKTNDGDNQTDFRKILINKPDAKNRPFNVLPNGRIFVEAFLPMYQQAEDFLVSIAEPVSRQRYCHQYQISAYSLYAGASMGISTDKIIEILDRFCKTNLPDEIIDFIKKCTTSYGKLNVILRNSKYFLESSLPETLKKLMEDREIKTCLLRPSDSLAILNKKIENLENFPGNIKKENEFDDIYKGLDNDDEDEDVYKKQNDGKLLMCFEVANGKLEHLQKRCMTLGFNPLAEYDFRHDTNNGNININLKPHAILRPYQEKSLRRMFGSGRARSGVIVLPCGAGKTLTGVAAACTVNKNCIILCTSGVAVDQWKSQFKYWSDATDDKISRFTSDLKDNPKGSNILISTYSMITHSSKRADAAEEVMKWVRQIEWGLMILDEVQFAPAKMFRKVISDIHAHCKLGLTATLVREDDKIADLNFLIGPKLYEANWLQLQDKGYIARVQCCEIACRMDPMFYREYLIAKKGVQQNLFVMNPEKMRICQFLIEYHEKRGDKIIVFADKIFSLKSYAKIFERHYICGEVANSERTDILENFKKASGLQTIFVSKVADNSFDLPDANVLIQISNVAGSRRQEAQRLGRILRAKKDSHNGECNAFFYSLVSQDTTETVFAHKRQRFLVQQGYSYKFINKLPGMEKANLVLSTEDERRDVLNKVLNNGEDGDKDAQEGAQGEDKPKNKEMKPSHSSTQPLRPPSATAYVPPTEQKIIENKQSISHASSVPHKKSSDAGKPQQADTKSIASIIGDTMKKKEPEKKKPAKAKNDASRHFLFKKHRK